MDLKKLFAVVSLICLIFTSCQKSIKTQDKNTFRGIVVYPSDINSVGVIGLIKFMKEAHLNLLGIHTNSLGRNPDTGEFENLPNLKLFLESQEGQLLLKECAANNISVEFESHVLEEILPRKLFKEHPEYFRMDENGERQKNHNMCFTLEEAYREIEKQIIETTKWLNPTTHRYFFWTDDVTNCFCHCDSCKKYTASEQALLFENRLLTILRKVDPLAQLAHLAYHNTLNAPVKVKPLDGIFLEYAPISRDYSLPLSEEHVQDLKDNLKIFPANTVHVLEYWLDASMYSRMNKVDRANVAKVPWDIEHCKRDVELYHNLGIRSITSFGTWMISDDYLKRYGEVHTRQIINEYGTVLKNYCK